MEKQDLYRITYFHGNFAPLYRGKVAIQFLAQSPRDIALAIIDWSMPVMNGPETLEKTVRLGVKNFPAYLTSGTDWSEAGGSDLLPPAKGFWGKPDGFSEFLQQLAGIIHTEKSLSKRVANPWQQTGLLLGREAATFAGCSA